MSRVTGGRGEIRHGTGDHRGYRELQGGHVLLGSASEGAKGRGAVGAKSGHSAQCYYHMLSAMLGTGEGKRANTSAESRA